MKTSPARMNLPDRSNIPTRARRGPSARLRRASRISAQSKPHPFEPTRAPRSGPRQCLMLYQANRGSPMACKKTSTVQNPSRMRVVAQPREQQVVLPDAIDAEVLTGKPFSAESGLLQQTDGGRVRRDAGGLDAMQPQRRKRKRQKSRH